MKNYSLIVGISAGVALGSLSFGLNSAQAAAAAPLQVAAGTSDQASFFQNVAWEHDRVEKLRHAYYLLEHADGDYHGHRAEAMHAIKRAGEVLGVEIKGGGHAEESQWASDRKLHEAKRLLEEVADEFGAREQAHVHTAIKELDRALAVR
jgi:hypothetical protein